MSADIAQGGSAQERVTNCMRESVPVGVAGRAAIEGNADAAQNQLATGRQAMDIVACSSSVVSAGSDS